MELDDLKQMWNEDKIKSNNTDIMKMIRNESNGPVAALRKVFRKQIILMSILPFFLFIVNMDDVHRVLTSFMYWSYVFFCLAVVIFFIYNIQILKKMEDMDIALKASLEQQLELLEKRMKWNIVGLRITLVYFIVLTEVVPYFQHYRMLDLWHSAHPLIRYAGYSFLLVLQYFFSWNICDRRFGTHMKHLKELVKDMQD